MFWMSCLQEGKAVSGCETESSCSDCATEDSTVGT